MQIAEEVSKFPFSWDRFNEFGIALGSKSTGKNIYKESTYSLTVVWISVCLTWIFGGYMEWTFELPTAKSGMQKKISRGKTSFYLATNHLAHSSLCASLQEPLMPLISVLIKLHSKLCLSGSHRRQWSSLQKWFRWEVRSRRVMEVSLLARLFLYCYHQHSTRMPSASTTSCTISLL